MKGGKKNMNKDEYIMERLQVLEVENELLRKQVKAMESFVNKAKSVQDLIDIKQSDNYDSIYNVFVCDYFIDNYTKDEISLPIKILKEFKEAKYE